MPNAPMIACAFVTSLLLAGCATGLSQTPPPGQPAAVPAPAATAGTIWSYRDVSTFMKANVMGEARWELAAADAPRLSRLQGTSGSLAPLVFTRNWELEQAALANLGDVKFSPPFPVLRFPLVPGERWRGVVTAAASDRGYPVDVVATVDGWERIVLPAGEFDAIRVSILASPDDAQMWRSRTRITQYWWYAPAVNGFVRRFEKSEWTVLGGDEAYVQQGDHNRMDLTSYRPGP